jgi:CRISPR-associated protein Cas2
METPGSAGDPPVSHLDDLPPEWPADANRPGSADGPPADDSPDGPAEAADHPDLVTLGNPFPAVLDHQERHKYLIAYDIRDPRRLHHVHERLKDFGKPVQYSIFEVLLPGRVVETMWEAVRQLIDPRVDWVILYRLMRPYDEAIRHIGCYDPDRIAEDDIIFV